MLRKHIPAGEAGVGFLILWSIVGATWWVATQRDAYDPGERDIDVALLVEGSVADTLYKTPLKRWRDPALGDAAGPAPVDISPFPAPLLADGWSAGRVETFVPDTLYEKINGQAEQYLRFGFQRLDVLTLTAPGGALGVDLFLYEQAGLAEALGLYAEQRGSKPAETLGPVHYTPTSLGAIGMVGPLFFHIISDREGPEVEAMRTRTLGAFGALAEADAEADEPLPLRVLRDGLGAPFADLAYLPTNALQLDFARRFWFARRDPQGRSRFFVHASDSPAAAQALVARLHAAQEEELETVEQDAGGVLCKHRFLKSYYAFRHQGAVVFGLENEAEEAATRQALAELDGAILGIVEDGAGGDEGYAEEGEQ